MPAAGDRPADWRLGAGNLIEQTPSVSVVRRPADGGPAETASVDSPRDRRRYSFAVSPDGHFRVEDVEPGDYELSVYGMAPEAGRDGRAAGSVSSAGNGHAYLRVPEGRSDEPLDIPPITLKFDAPPTSAEPRGTAGDRPAVPSGTQPAGRSAPATKPGATSTAMADRSANPGPASAPAAARPTGRVLRFPADRSVGALYVRSDAEPSRVGRGIDWTFLASARGDVQLPAGQQAKLEVGRAAALDPAALAGLRPDDLRAMQLGVARTSDAFLAAVGRLTGLRSLWLSTDSLADPDGVTDAGLDSLGRLTELEDLTLYLRPGRDVTEAGIAVLGRLGKLRQIWLSGVRLTDRSAEVIGSLTALEDLSVGPVAFTDAGVAKFARLDRLRRLSLYAAPVDGAAVVYRPLTDAAADAVGRLPRLEELNLGGSPLTGDTVGRLARGGQLKTLRLFSAQLDDAAVDLLVRDAPALEEFNVAGLRLTADGAGQLAGLRSLRSISVDAGMTDAAVAALASLPRLEWLSTYGDAGDEAINEGVNDLLTDAAAEHLARCPTLRAVRLNGVIGDRGLRALCEAGRLERLAVPQRVTPAGLAALAGLTHLKELTLINSTVGPGTAAHVGRVASLERLEVHIAAAPATARFPADELAALAGLKHLNALLIHEAREFPPAEGVTDAVARAWSGMPELREIWMSGTSLTDDGLAALGRLPKLDWLSAEGRFTDAGLDALAGARSLRYLSLYQPSGFPKSFGPEAVARLRAANPDLHTLDVRVRTTTPASRATTRAATRTAG